jgi:MFS family permease
MFAQLFQLDRFSAYDAKNLRQNIHAHIWDGALFGLAMTFVSVQTILPVYLQEIGGSMIVIGSVPVLWNIGMNLPQIFFLRFTHRADVAIPALLRYGLLHRVMFLIVGVFTFIAVPSIYAAKLGMLLLLMTAITGSLGVPPWFQVFTKTTPVTLRGRVIALRQLLSAICGVLAGALVSFILAAISFPMNFSMLFCIAFAISMVSYYFLTRLRESASPASTTVEPDLASLLKQGKNIVRGDHNFRNFLIADGMILISLTATAFYAVYGLEKFHHAVSYTGIFTTVMMGSMVAANILFGYLADHRGHKINLIIFALSLAAASVIAVIATSNVIFCLVFVCMGCAVSVQGISRMSFVAELCSEELRPLYIALTNTLTAPAVFFGIVAGVLIRGYGYEPILVAYGIIGVAAAVWLELKVQEPRWGDHHKRSTAHP